MNVTTWYVYLNGFCIRSVIFSSDKTEAQVRNTLINVDGFNPLIQVRMTLTFNHHLA